MNAPFVIDPAAMSTVNTAAGEKDPHFIGGRVDRLYLSFASGRLGVSRLDGTIYRAPEPLPVTVPGVTIYADPQGSPDELTLVFSANLPATDGDFFVTTRNSTTEAFGPPWPLAALNTPALERDLSISNDGCELWFSRDSGAAEIWTSRVIR
jgi:hypothetical protein